MDINIKALELAGLSNKEASVYLDLLRYGESQTGKICYRTDVPSSRIYSILGALLEKGLVNYKLVNNIKVFRASDPDALSQLFEEREKEVHESKIKLADAISKLKTLAPQPSRLSDFKYFEGTRGVKSLFSEITHSWKRGDEYYIVSSPQEAFSKLEPFFLGVVNKKRVEDGVGLKIIINEDAREWGPVRKNMPLTKVRYLDIDTKTEYGVLNDYFFLVTYAAKPYGLLIKDANFASTYKAFFELIWEQARP